MGTKGAKKGKKWQIPGEKVQQWMEHNILNKEVETRNPLERV